MRGPFDRDPSINAARPTIECEADEVAAFLACFVGKPRGTYVPPVWDDDDEPDLTDWKADR